MIYPFKCRQCAHPFDVSRSMSVDGPEPCPLCKRPCEQDYSRKTVNSHVSTEGDWTGGKAILQLPKDHPDYMVTNRNDMADAYKRNGLCMDTGKLVSKEAQVKATIPRGTAQEAALSNPDLAVGGVREES